MKPHELADTLISSLIKNFDLDNYCKLTIGWNHGELECSLLTKVKFGDKKTEYHSTHNENDFAGVEIPLLNSWSLGCLRLDYFIRPCDNMNNLRLTIVSAIYDCIKKYEAQLESELEKTKESLKLINEQY